MKHITIIGGGITGLSCAHYLQKLGRERGTPIAYTLLEAGPELGGKIATRTMGDLVIEGGPDSFITLKRGGLQLCEELGISDRLIPCNEQEQMVHILRRGKLCALPAGFRLAVPTKFLPFIFSPLLSPWGKVRMLMDLFIPARTEEGDESLASFIERRLGREALATVAGPLMAGIYVADPERLSIDSTFPRFVDMERKYGSLIRAVLKARNMHVKTGNAPPAMFMSLKGGMGELVDALRKTLGGDIRCDASVSKLSVSKNGFDVQVGNDYALHSDAVVLTTPAHVTAELVSPLHEELAGELRRIRYVSTATISLAYKAADIPPARRLPGFGFLAPKSEGRDILACTCSSTKFAHRASSDHILYRVFVGGAGKEQLVDLDDEALLALVRRELADILDLHAEPVTHAIWRWPLGNAQYDVGHLDRVARMEKMAASVPGLHLAGSAYRGIGIPDCAETARDLAGKILTHVGDRSPQENKAS